MLHTFGPLLLDFEHGVADGPAGRHPLTPLEVRLLQRLVEGGGATVERGDLLREVWGYRPSMVTRTVDVAVARLRTKLEPDPAEPRWLRSERGVGYRLIAEPAGEAPAAPPAPPLDHPLVGRQAAIEQVEQALGAGPAQLCGVPGVGLRAVARAVAARFRGPVGWIELGGEESAEATIAARMGWANDPVNVRARLAAFEGLLVFLGAPEGLSLGARRLVVGGPPRRATNVVTLAPLGDADALALLRQLSPRPLADDEVEAARALTISSRGLPALLALHARELRFARAEALVASPSLSGDPLAPAREAARARLPAPLRAALGALSAYGTDVPYSAAVVVIDAAGVADAPGSLDELVRAGWVATGWSREGEVRFRPLAPAEAPATTPVALLRWLLTLPEPAFVREAGLVMAAAGAADPAAPMLPELVERLHGAVRVRGGWRGLAAVVSRLPGGDPRLDYASAEAGFYSGDAAGAITRLQAALAVLPPTAPRFGEMCALCGFYLSRTGRRDEARACFARVADDGSRGALEVTFLASLLDSEAGIGADTPRNRLRAALSHAERFGDPRLVARARAYLATALWHAGDPAAIPHFERAEREAEAIDALANAALMRSVHAWALAEAGELVAAEETARAAEDALTVGENGAAARGAARARAVALQLAGRLDEARAVLLPLLAAPDVPEALLRAQLAALEAAAGARDDAARHAEVANAQPAGPDEGSAATAGWLAAAGFGPRPDPSWTACSPEVRLAARFAAQVPRG